MLNVYTVEETAKLLRTSKCSVYKLIKEGKLNASRVGLRTLRISEDDIRTYLAKTRIIGTEEDFETLTKLNNEQ